MDARLFTLTLPSAIVLALLVAHSARTLPGRRATVFWVSVLIYGLARGAGVTWVTRYGLGAAPPYVIHHPIAPVFGVSLQEVAGWAIVCYLGWWLGARFSRAVFVQVAWACLFLGSASWLVETAASAAGWWHWTVSVPGGLLENVPFIGLVDWFFAGTDFLLPFLALTAPSLARHPARFATLLVFPLHFAGHLFVNRVAPAIPIPVFHLIHWMLLGALLWLAARSRAEDAPFMGEDARGRRTSWMPLTGLSIIIAVAAAVEVVLARRPALVASTLPAIVMGAQSIRPMLGYGVAAAGLMMAALIPPALLAAVPPAAAAVLGVLRRHARWAPAAGLVALAIAAWTFHATSARAESDLTRRLGAATAARDRGDLDIATRELDSARVAHPGSHVPAALLAEIAYRQERLEPARRLYAQTVRLKPDFVDGYRHLAVIALRLANKEEAARAASDGLVIAPGDFELRYLQQRARGGSLTSMQAELGAIDKDRARSLASLAWEVGDAQGAVALVQSGISRWPRERWFHATRFNIARARNDPEAARGAVADWKRSLPGDSEAARIAREMGVE